MNTPIRRVGYAMVVLMLVLVGQLTYLQVVQAKELCEDSRNVRRLIRDSARPRGDILSADGAVLAESIPTTDDLKFQRNYPEKGLFAHIVGYQSFTIGSSGIEAKYNDQLAGRINTDCVRNVSELEDAFKVDSQSAQVLLNVRKDAQQIAANALGANRGSVVVIEPETGAVIAMYSNPTYDPNPLTSHDRDATQAALAALNNDPTRPAVPRTYAELYPPGSTFKVLTAAVGLDEGVTDTEKVYPVARSLDVPQTSNNLSNFGGGFCGGNLMESFVHSCNTTFGQMGLDLGDSFITGMEGFGLGESPPLDTLHPSAEAGTTPALGSFENNKPDFAFAGIGQGQVATSPLQMASITAAIANGGRMMEPHLVAEVLDSDGGSARVIKPKAWHNAATVASAETVKEMMIQVVKRGTGTAARISGVTVAGKTGTAQVDGNNKPHAWFVGFAPAESPRYAIAVLVENGGNLGSEATGGRVAAPIAKTVLSQMLNLGS